MDSVPVLNARVSLSTSSTIARRFKFSIVTVTYNQFKTNASIPQSNRQQNSRFDKQIGNSVSFARASLVPVFSSRVEIYSLRAVSKFLAGKPEGWNREHLWPRSYGLTDGTSLTDLHNIRPADVNGKMAQDIFQREIKEHSALGNPIYEFHTHPEIISELRDFLLVNSSRGNKYYGECAATSIACSRPANSEAAPDTEADRESWAPPTQVRGDIARSLMYMAVRYRFKQPGGNLNLQLSDSPSSEKRQMGLVSALLKWNETDPPSRAEKLRNDRICRLYQHNRNPFVDHPEYANLIWKQCTSTGSPIVYAPSSNAWINEFHYNNKGKDRNEFVEVVTRSSTDAAGLELVLYNGANGQVYMSLPLANQRVFTIANGGSLFLTYTAYIPLQNGPGDGLALVSVKDGGNLNTIQFISYEGVVKATEGPATGLESTDINLRETEDSSDHDSLGIDMKGYSGAQMVQIHRWSYSWRAKHRAEPCRAIDTPLGLLQMGSVYSSGSHPTTPCRSMGRT